MGLLTDPSAGQGKITKALLKFSKKLCILLYLSGVAWFCLLAYPPMNASTYFSENALLPGLVKSEFRDDKTANIYYNELKDEMEKYPNGVPYSWLTAKFRQIGLDSYTHNFTLNYPLGPKQKFRGKNVYGILRAARASSTESLVLSVPFRPLKSVHQTTAPSVAVMLAFAKFANKEKYWAKDIIFLITEHEQLGIQAWLQAYHGVNCGNDGVLDHGDLRGRAGAIQAAINLELHDIMIGQIDVKIEGLNGQLPNLDLFNLATKMCYNENIFYTFKNKPARNWRDPFKEWLYAFKTLMAMVFTQATGIPNGNHGLYHRFGIEALTIEGFPNSNIRGSSKVGLLTIGRLIEGIFRSLNNLLERFHQSFFFYLLPASDRFVSIGLYMPAICLIIGTLFIKACAMWFQLQHQSNKNGDEDSKRLLNKIEKIQWESIQEKAAYEIKNGKKYYSTDLVKVLFFFIFSHVLGVLIMHSPQYLVALGDHYGYATNLSLIIGLANLSIFLFFLPLFIPFRSCERSMKIFNILALLELGTVLIAVSMMNFSLAMLGSVLYVPLGLIISATNNKLYSRFQKVIWLLAHPLLILAAIVFVYTQFMFPGEPLKDNLQRTWGALRHALVFSVVDSMIYGNWLFNVLTSIFIPNWICFWFVTFFKADVDGAVVEPSSNENKKTN